MSRLSPQQPTIPGSDLDTQDSNMQQFFQDLLGEFRKVGDAIAGLSDRMGKVETNVSHILKRQDEQSALDSRVESNDRRIGLLERAAKDSEQRASKASEWTRWAVGLVVGFIVMAIGAGLSFAISHIHWK